MFSFFLFNLNFPIYFWLIYINTLQESYIRNCKVWIVVTAEYTICDVVLNLLILSHPMQHLSLMWNF